MAGPSRTAKKIARFVVLLDSVARLRGVLPAGAAEIAERILRASPAVRGWEVDMMRAAWTRRAYDRIERWIGGRGQLLWFGLRKRVAFDEVEAALEAGATQLLVVGAGFDPLATLIARRRPDVLCVEIDAPRTATPKREGIATADLQRPNLHVLAVDLAERSLADALAAVPWRADACSIVVAEGLLMYLRRPDVEAFFTASARVTGPGSRIVFTAVGVDEAGRPRVGVLDRTLRVALRLVGEAMHWGIDPADLAGFLSPLGWSVRAQPTLDDLRAKVLDPLGLHDEPVTPYEHVAIAERCGP